MEECSYLERDLTGKEREAEKKLREELERKREQGEEHYIIRHGKVMKVPAREMLGNQSGNF